jgi:FKBP-type peptidyl-prolyl cis-trans isomerase
MSVATIPSGLHRQDTAVGQGPVAAAGDRVSVHAAGWLSEDGAKGAGGAIPPGATRCFEIDLGCC